MSNRGRVLFSLMFVAVLFLAPHLSIIPVKASPLTTVTLDLQDETPEVDVSPGSSGIVEVFGEVTCNKYGPDEVKVFLTGQSETGGCSVEPPSFVFSGVSGSEETEPFILTIRVPMGYTSKATPELSVGGNFDQGGLRTSISPVSTMIVVLQYYKIEYEVKERSFRCNSGEDAEIKFRAINVANGDDTFIIDIENGDSLESEGFKLFTPMEIQMPEDENKSVSLKIEVPEGISGDYLVEVSIVSKGSLDSGYPEMVVIVFELKVEPGSIGEVIGSILTSPLTILILVIVIITAIVLKLKQKKGVPSSAE